ncbi:MAG: hypothetical protein ABIJ09_09930 [Pseudomonadota bacterium]
MLLPLHSVASSPATQAAQDKRLLVMELQYGGDVKADLAHTLTELVTIKLSDMGTFYVISGSEITQVAVLESEKQKLGCAENSCLAEVAEALGARFVVFGRASTLGELYIVQLRLFDARTAQFIERVTVESRSVEELTHNLPASLDQLVAPILDPGEHRALVSRRAEQDAAEPGVNPEQDGGAPVLLIAGLGALGLGAVAAVATTGGAIYFNSIVADPAGTGKTEAQASGTAVLLGGGLSSVALLATGALLTGLGLLD